MTKYEKYVKEFNKLDMLFIAGYLWNGSPHDYGNGILLNLMEAHILQYIVEHSNVIVMDIAKYFNITRSAASKIISRLEKKGLIVKEQHTDSKKKIYILVTETGHITADLHYQHDETYYREALEKLLECHSIDDIKIFFQVLDTYLNNHP